MGEVNRLTGTVRGGQFHVGAHRRAAGYTPAYRGAGRFVPASVEVDWLAAAPARFSAARAYRPG